jgi:dienelactone hydrolase
MRELEDAGADWQVLAFGGAAHGFMNRDNANMQMPPGIIYHEPTELRAWTAMKRFFVEIFG